VTAGNQGRAYDQAKANLKKDPKNQVLQVEFETRKGQLNKSLRDAHQKEVS